MNRKIVILFAISLVLLSAVSVISPPSNTDIPGGLLCPAVSTIENKSENISFSEINTSAPSLYSLIKARVECGEGIIFLSDDYYDSISDTAFNVFLEEDDTNLIPPRPEIFDCDDYALHLMLAARLHFAEENKNAALGMLWVDEHAVNFYINMSHDLYIFDPQTEKEYIPKGDVYFVYI